MEQRFTASIMIEVNIHINKFKKMYFEFHNLRLFKWFFKIADYNYDLEGK
jgi:hypothetical protein